MTKYLDGTETDALDRPQWCPYCKGKLASRWRGQTQGFVGSARGASEVAWPFFVCLKCQITVRVARLPVEPLRTTRKAAKADAAKINAADLARWQSTRDKP